MKNVQLGARTLSNLWFLKKLSRLKSFDSLKNGVKKADFNQLACLIDCAANILDIRFPLKREHRSRLKIHADFVRELSRARSTKRVCKIVQKASLNAIKSLILPVLLVSCQNAKNDLGSRIRIQVTTGGVKR